MKSNILKAFYAFIFLIPLFLISCGKNIEEGPKGGKYYRNSAGNKTYVNRETHTGESSNAWWIIILIIVVIVVLAIIVTNVVKNIPTTEEIEERRIRKLAKIKAGDYILNEWVYTPRKYDGRHTYASNLRHREASKFSAQLEAEMRFFKEIKEEENKQNDAKLK